MENTSFGVAKQSITTTTKLWLKFGCLCEQHSEPASSLKNSQQRNTRIKTGYLVSLSSLTLSLTIGHASSGEGEVLDCHLATPLATRL
jgi:hypothetical protein